MKNLYNGFSGFLGGPQHRFTTPFFLAYPFGTQRPFFFNFKTLKLQNFNSSSKKNTKDSREKKVELKLQEKQSPKKQNSPDSLERAGRGCLVTNLI
jgi:hypothetical protein